MVLRAYCASLPVWLAVCNHANDPVGPASGRLGVRLQAATELSSKNRWQAEGWVFEYQQVVTALLPNARQYV